MYSYISLDAFDVKVRSQLDPNNFANAVFGLFLSVKHATVATGLFN